MTDALTSERMSLELVKVVERAQREPEDGSTHWRI